MKTPAIVAVCLCVAASLACVSGPQERPRKARAAPEASEPDPPHRKRGRKARSGPGADRPAPARKDCDAGIIGHVSPVPGFRDRGGAQHPGPVEVLARPRADAPTLATIESDGQHRDGALWCAGAWGDQPCASIGTGRMETFGLPVYAVRGSWAQVGFGPGKEVQAWDVDCARGWVALDAPLAFVPLAEQLEGQTIHLVQRTWAGTYHDRPGGPKKRVDKEAANLEVLQTREVDGVLWVEGRFFPGIICEDDGTATARGWVPVLGQGGRLQVTLYGDC